MDIDDITGLEIAWLMFLIAWAGVLTGWMVGYWSAKRRYRNLDKR